MRIGGCTTASRLIIAYAYLSLFEYLKICSLTTTHLRSVVVAGFKNSLGLKFRTWVQNQESAQATPMQYQDKAA